MSDNNDNRKDDNKDDRDPYDFFKLSVEPNNDDDKKHQPKKHHTPFWTIILIAVGVIILFNMLFANRTDDNLIDFSEFRSKVETGEIKRVELGDTYFIGYTTTASAASRTNGFLSLFKQDTDQGQVYKTTGLLMQSFIDLLDQKGVDYKIVTKSNGILLQIFLNLLPVILIIIMYLFIFRKMGGGMSGMGSMFGNGAGKSKAVDEGKVKTRFTDVAGVDEAKEELVEVVDFLKSPKKYTDIGGKIPKGVLLVGPPGTGKTLLARAVAGEAGVPFYRISGSDFVEMFVGVGASRVRDLFRTAREKAPCIIFIDELDAIGKSRVNNLGGNDEREQTLNQLLVEMDGFDNEKGLIVLGATNRPDVLDPALLRPGRFDRQVVVDKPDVKGREAILRIHAKNVKIDSSVDFEGLAHATSGFAGADLANIVNEAALLAVRNGRKVVIMDDFDEAIEKTLVGLQKKTRVVKENERHIVAYHETGHALVAAFTPGSDPVHKISIIPRGMGALGYTLQRSEDESFLKSQKELLGEVDVLLGGRAAEQIVFGEISTGASNDISRATDVVKSMITDYGMSEKFKNMTLGKSGKGYGGPQEPELVREYSEETQKYIDDEIARIMDEEYTRVLKLLKTHKELLEYIAKRLLEKETMEGKEFEDIIKAESHCEELTAEAGKKAEEQKYITASALGASSSADSTAGTPEMIALNAPADVPSSDSSAAEGKKKAPHKGLISRIKKDKADKKEKKVKTPKADK
jgi:cell division protease FtsH